MKKLFTAIFSMLLFSHANAGPFLGNLGAAFQGQEKFQKKQKLDQCVASCESGDGRCYSGCAAVYGPQEDEPKQQSAPQPVPQPLPSVKQTDYSCVNQCSRNGYQYGLCLKNCSY